MDDGLKSNQVNSLFECLCGYINNDINKIMDVFGELLQHQIKPKPKIIGKTF